MTASVLGEASQIYEGKEVNKVWEQKPARETWEALNVTSGVKSVRIRCGGPNRVKKGGSEGASKLRRGASPKGERRSTSLL